MSTPDLDRCLHLLDLIREQGADDVADFLATLARRELAPKVKDVLPLAIELCRSRDSLERSIGIDMVDRFICNDDSLAVWRRQLVADPGSLMDAPNRPNLLQLIDLLLRMSLKNRRKVARQAREAFQREQAERRAEVLRRYLGMHGSLMERGELVDHRPEAVEARRRGFAEPPPDDPPSP